MADNMGNARGRAVIDRPVAEGMAAFDACGPAVRAALRDAPFRFDAVQAIEVERTRGAAIAVEVIAACVQQIDPGYRPMRPVPRRRRR